LLIGGIVLGLLLGLLAGGSLTNLATVRLRWVGLLAVAVLVRFGVELLLNAGVEWADALRVPLLLAGFGLLLAGLWANRSYPGLSLAFVGILLNAIVILLNAGYMPIWAPSLEIAGYSPDEVNSTLHFVVPGAITADFLVNAIFLGDVIPIPLPLVRNVASLGDLFLSLGLAFFLFASVLREESQADREADEAISRSGLNPAFANSAALSRPLVLGARGTGLASPTATAMASTGGGAAAAPAIPIPRPTPEALERVRRHPYVRLALNGSFSALWAGQLISLFGDRIHQLALAAVVLITTGSVLASALVFVAATLPNLFLSPVAGAFVDRWDHKEVLVVSDLLRAAAVLLVPIAVVTNVVLVYPLVFLITTISIFFRPARVAILPRIVRDDELLSANSAMWVGETIADIIGWPLAGLFIVALGNALPIAFWLDAATYVASAALLSSIVVPAAINRREAASDSASASASSGSVSDDPVEATADDEPARGRIVDELKDGWRFLRGEPTLLANTIQATVAQLAVGILIALTPAFARAVFGDQPIGWEAVYSFIETGQALGSLIGGFLLGLVGTRLAKGRLIISGYALFGLLIALFGLSGNLTLVLGLSFGMGVANMVWLIPSQTLFQQRTPSRLMGRVVGFRFSLVFGAMTASMAFGGLLAEVIGVTVVIAVFGLVTMAAGLAGLFVPAVRDA
jgi:MFS family permease